MWPAVPTTRRFLISPPPRAAAATSHPAQRFLQIHRVHDRLAAKVIVRDHVRVLIARHAANALDPRRELLLRVEVVVALPRLAVREPLLVVAALQARVADRAGDGVCRLDGVAEQRLIDVHPRDAALVEEAKKLVVLK